MLTNISFRCLLEIIWLALYATQSRTGRMQYMGMLVRQQNVAVVQDTEFRNSVMQQILGGIMLSVWFSVIPVLSGEPRLFENRMDFGKSGCSFAQL